MRYAFVFLALFMLSCSSHKYAAYKKNYSFKSNDGAPDYSRLDYWAAHPFKWDPSDSVPLPLRGEPRDSTVDVFFLHPTTYTHKKNKGNNNALIDDDFLNAKTDYSTILYQASVFNQQCRVFAPRYRQAHISNFFTQDKEKATAAFDLAYSDLKAAFIFYLEHWNGGRPIIIAAHSQGSMLGERLLKDFFDADDAGTARPLKDKLVAAYIIGWAFPKDLFTSLKPCMDSLQTGCICSWRTVRVGFNSPFLRNEKGVSFVTNPLNWTTSDTYAPRSLNKGSVLRDFNQIYLHTTDALVSNGLLYVHKPKFPGSFAYWSRNYHIGDINLFYINLREDIRRRIGLFWKQ